MKQGSKTVHGGRLRQAEYREMREAYRKLPDSSIHPDDWSTPIDIADSTYPDERRDPGAQRTRRQPSCARNRDQ